jgi:hypothetical protein
VRSSDNLAPQHFYIYFYTPSTVRRTPISDILKYVTVCLKFRKYSKKDYEFKWHFLCFSITTVHIQISSSWL